jgi:hypothetical protein
MNERNLDRFQKPLAGVIGRRSALRAAGAAGLTLLAALGAVDRTAAKNPYKKKAKKVQCRYWKKSNADCRAWSIDWCQQIYADGTLTDLDDCLTNYVGCCDLGEKQCTVDETSECQDNYVQSRWPL